MERVPKTYPPRQASCPGRASHTPLFYHDRGLLHQDACGVCGVAFLSALKHGVSCDGVL